MYMVVWTLHGGRQLTQNRVWVRRRRADRALFKMRQKHPGVHLHVERVSFWCRSAFEAVMAMVIGAGLIALVVVEAVLVLKGAHARVLHP